MPRSRRQQVVSVSRNESKEQRSSGAVKGEGAAGRKGVRERRGGSGRGSSGAEAPARERKGKRVPEECVVCEGRRGGGGGGTKGPKRRL